MLAAPVMLAPIDEAATGQHAGAVSTGAPDPTKVADQNCADWTTKAAATSSTVGTAAYTGVGFFSGYPSGCDRGNGVYCLQD